MRVNQAETPPCPAWCIYGAAHAFEPSDDPTVMWRQHDHPVRWLQWSHVDGGMPAVSVWMSQAEQSVAADGPILSRPVEIVIESSELTRLTGPQARQLAAGLIDAANLWDAADRSANLLRAT